MEKIAYAEHPLSQQEKKEIQEQGFRIIIDLKFKPDELQANDKIFAKQQKKRKIIED